MKDGTVLEFKHEPRAGGSYTKTIAYEGGMAIVTDEYYRKTAIPISDIKHINEIPDRY
jgi:hypothetical protein